MPRRSSSAWSCGKARSPSSPTWCSPSRPWWRRRGIIPQLGGPDPAVRSRRWPAMPPRTAGARSAGRRDRRRPRVCPTRRPPARNWPSSAGRAGRARRAPTCRRRSRPLSPDRARQCWPDGECCWTRAGCRTASRYLAGTAGRRWPAVGDHRGRDRRRRRVIRSQCATDRGDHPAARDHRHARPGGVAADELTGIGGRTRNSVRPRRRRGSDRTGSDDDSTRIRRRSATTRGG